MFIITPKDMRGFEGINAGGSVGVMPSAHQAWMYLCTLPPFLDRSIYKTCPPQSFPDVPKLGLGDRNGLSQPSVYTQMPPQSAPPFMGSQSSVGSSTHFLPSLQGIPANPPQKTGLTQMPGMSQAMPQPPL